MERAWARVQRPGPKTQACRKADPRLIAWLKSELGLKKRAQTRLNSQIKEAQQTWSWLGFLKAYDQLCLETLELDTSLVLGQP